jgi:hypothetical protein
MLVLAKMRDTSVTSPIVPMASCEPPLKPNQPSHRMNVPSVASGMVGARHRVDLAVLVLAQARAEDDGAGQSCPATDGVHDGGACEVGEAHLGEPAAAPLPGGRDRVDEAGQDDGEDQERPQLDALGQVPDTIEAVAAQNTIWKNQSDPVE